MAFKNFFAAGTRRTGFRHRGRSDGRLTGSRFHQFVRKPFHERALLGELYNNRPHHAYNVFDRNIIRDEVQRGQRSQNMSHLASYATLKELRAIKRENFPRRISSPQALFPKR